MPQMSLSFLMIIFMFVWFVFLLVFVLVWWVGKQKYNF